MTTGRCGSSSTWSSHSSSTSVVTVQVQGSTWNHLVRVIVAGAVTSAVHSSRPGPVTTSPALICQSTRARWAGSQLSIWATTGASKAVPSMMNGRPC